MANWTVEGVRELLINWVTFHKYGHINANFRCGEILNIEKYESLKFETKEELFDYLSNWWEYKKDGEVIIKFIEGKIPNVMAFERIPPKTVRTKQEEANGNTER